MPTVRCDPVKAVYMHARSIRLHKLCSRSTSLHSHLFSILMSWQFMIMRIFYFVYINRYLNVKKTSCHEILLNLKYSIRCVSSVLMTNTNAKFHEIYILSCETLRNLSPIILAPAKLSAADGNCLHRSNHAAMSGYFLRSPPNSYDQMLHEK